MEFSCNTNMMTPGDHGSWINSKAPTTKSLQIPPSQMPESELQFFITGIVFYTYVSINNILVDKLTLLVSKIVLDMFAQRENSERK